MNAGGSANSVLVAALAADIDKKENHQKKNKNIVKQEKQIVIQETISLLEEQIKNINNVSIEKNVESKCCPSCTIL